AGRDGVSRRHLPCRRLLRNVIGQQDSGGRAAAAAPRHFRRCSSRAMRRCVMATPIIAPSRAALTRAVAINRQYGHENLGFLSEEHGLTPAQPPLLQMPPSHRAWDDIIDRMPEYYRTLALREVIDAMPELGATEADFPDLYLCRASALLSFLAHAYYRVKI